MLMALTPVVASNMVPRSRFSPPLASSCLVLPPCSSTEPSRLTCLQPFSALLSYCDFVFMWHALAAATWHGGEKRTHFHFLLKSVFQLKSKESLMIH